LRSLLKFMAWRSTLRVLYGLANLKTSPKTTTLMRNRPWETWMMTPRPNPLEEELDITALEATTSVQDDWLHRGPFLLEMDFHTYIRFTVR